MKRFDIIANKAVENDLKESLQAMLNTCYYTMINNVQGLGSSGPRYGDNIWPEENFILIIYLEDEKSPELLDAVKHLKQKFPDIGIKCYEMSGVIASL